MSEEHLMEGDESHFIEVFNPRHYPDTAEIWCPTVDETVGVLAYRYLRHCPMCGDEVGVGE